MPYVINHYNGQNLVTLPDTGVINNSACSLTLVGRNYPGFGAAIAENFVYLLENFSSPTAPTNPMTGQIWYNSAQEAGILNVFNGSAWEPVGFAGYSGSGSTTFPSSIGVSGDGVGLSITNPNAPAGEQTYMITVVTSQSGLTVDGSQWQVQMMDGSTVVSVPLVVDGVDNSIFSPIMESTRMVLSNPQASAGTRYWDCTVTGNGDGSFEVRSLNDDQSVNEVMLVLNSVTGSLFSPQLSTQQVAISNPGAPSGERFWLLTSETPTVAGTLQLQSLNDDQSLRNVVLSLDPAANVVTVGGLAAATVMVANNTSPPGMQTWGLYVSGIADSYPGRFNVQSYDTTGAPTSQMSVDQSGTVYATTFNGIATSAEYADLAERYETSEPLAPGDLVEIGGPKEIQQTRGDATTAVFGVVSGQPGVRMNEMVGGDATHPFVAFCGRLPCKVVGPVHKGQRLVASQVNGVARGARKLDPYEAIFGRALADKTDEAVAMIEVVIGTR